MNPVVAERDVVERQDLDVGSLAERVGGQQPGGGPLEAVGVAVAELSAGPVAAAGAVGVWRSAQPTSTAPTTRPAPRTETDRRWRSAGRTIARR